MADNSQSLEVAKKKVDDDGKERKSTSDKIKDKIKRDGPKVATKVLTKMPKGPGSILDLMWSTHIDQDKHAKAFEDDNSAEWKFRVALQETLTDKQTIHEALAERERQMQETEKQLAQETAQREAARRAESQRQKAERERAERDARDRGDRNRADRDRFESEGGNFRAPAGGGVNN